MEYSQKQTENTANQQPSEKVHESPKDRSMWINLRNIKYIQIPPMGVGFVVAYLDGTHTTLSFNPLGANRCFGREDWVTY
jgi:hypothetical protein